ncbi:MAG: helix-turn-helix transcriptional regulator [Euryarchaeota archaeon]|nr:helix-turn-helix transcriptional regulator [Euryarchaeota archaeon]
MGLLDELPDIGGDILGELFGTIKSILDSLFEFLFGPEAAVVGGAAAAAATYRWWKYPFASLFTRILKPRALDQPARARIHAYMRENPGVRAHDLVKALDLATGQTMHHLRMLEHQGLIVRTGGPFSRRYFLKGSMSPREMAQHVARQNPALAGLQDAVAASPGISVAQVSESLHVSAPHASRLALQLAAAGLIERVPEGRVVRLFPRP